MAVFTPNLTLLLPLSEERTALAHEKVMAFAQEPLDRDSQARARSRRKGFDTSNTKINRPNDQTINWLVEQSINKKLRAWCSDRRKADSEGKAVPCPLPKRCSWPAVHMVSTVLSITIWYGVNVLLFQQCLARAYCLDLKGSTICKVWRGWGWLYP